MEHGNQDESVKAVIDTLTGTLVPSQSGLSPRLGPGNWPISNVTVSSFDRARVVTDIATATADVSSLVNRAISVRIPSMLYFCQGAMY